MKIHSSRAHWAARLGWTHALPEGAPRWWGLVPVDRWDGSLLLLRTSDAIASFVCLRQPIFVTTFLCKFMLFLLHGGLGRLATFKAFIFFPNLFP